jgi:hypothetical protein
MLRENGNVRPRNSREWLESSGGRRKATHPLHAPLVGNALSSRRTSHILELAPITMRTRRIFAILLAILSVQCLLAGDNSWNKIRFIGGTIPAKGYDPYDWNTTLVVRADGILMTIGHRQTLRIPPAQISTISYGQEAHRRVGEMVALSAIVTPVALFGLLHKGKDHYIGIEYHGDDGKTASVLLEADKNNYRAVLDALKTVTGRPVENAP